MADDAAAAGLGGGADPAAAALALLQGMGDPQQDEVQRLEEDRRNLKRLATEKAKALGNAKKRQKRLMEKAKTLSDLQLMSIVTSRAAKAKAKGKAKAKAKANG